MIQDIFPHKYSNVFKDTSAGPSAPIVAVREQKLCFRYGESGLELPTVAEAEKLWNIDRSRLKFLFTIDETDFFLCDEELEEKEGYGLHPLIAVRGLEPAHLSFAAAVGAHIAYWYDTNRFCGKCGSPYIHKKNERALICPECGHTSFPRINPIVIAAVTDGDKLLVARYNKKHFNPGSDQYVLLAGYVEIGESYEDTVRREIREETGLEIRKLQYVGSQPWPFSQTAIAGVYVEADSRKPLCIQEDELSELLWVRREELPPRKNLTSMTDNLIEWFRHGKTIEEIRAGIS